MKYTVTLHNDWNEPYYQSSKKKMKVVCQHIMDDTYVVEGLDFCKEVLKDFLDAPTAQMTLEQARKDFEDKGIGPLPQEKLQAIVDYYNGRMKLQNDIFKTLDENGDKPGLLKFDIPMRYNYFACYSDDNEERLVKQLSAWIKVEVKNESIHT